MVARLVERDSLESSEMGGSSMCNLFKALFKVQLHLLLLIAAAKTASHPTLSTRGGTPPPTT